MKVLILLSLVILLLGCTQTDDPKLYSEEPDDYSTYYLALV